MDYFEREKALKHVSEIHELAEVTDFLEDERFEEVLELALKIIARPDIPPASVKNVMGILQASSLLFKNKANYYMTLNKGKTGSPENNKKNLYMSMANECHELAQTLKYYFKDGS